MIWNFKKSPAATIPCLTVDVGPTAKGYGIVTASGFYLEIGYTGAFPNSALSRA